MTGSFAPRPRIVCPGHHSWLRIHICRLSRLLVNLPAAKPAKVVWIASRQEQRIDFEKPLDTIFLECPESFTDLPIPY
jgi:hypothetical protein